MKSKPLPTYLGIGFQYLGMFDIEKYYRLGLLRVNQSHYIYCMQSDAVIPTSKQGRHSSAPFVWIWTYTQGLVPLGSWHRGSHEVLCTQICMLVQIGEFNMSEDYGTLALMQPTYQHLVIIAYPLLERHRYRVQGWNPLFHAVSFTSL